MGSTQLSLDRAQLTPSAELLPAQCHLHLSRPVGTEHLKLPWLGVQIPFTGGRSLRKQLDLLNNQLPPAVFSQSLCSCDLPFPSTGKEHCNTAEELNELEPSRELLGKDSKVTIWIPRWILHISLRGHHEASHKAKNCLCRDTANMPWTGNSSKAMHLGWEESWIHHSALPWGVQQKHNLLQDQQADEKSQWVGLQHIP